MISRPQLCTLSAAAVTLVLPASSLALGGSTNQRCYTHVPLAKGAVKTQPIVVGVNGGTPGARFQVTVYHANGSVAGSSSGTFDVGGAGLTSVANVFPTGVPLGPLKGQKLRVTVQDYATDATVTLGTVRLTNLAVTASDKPRNPRLRRTVRVSGTPFRRKKLYGFVTSRDGKDVLRRFRIGRANGCGYARTRAVVAPRDFAYGRYRLYVNGGRRIKRQKAIVRTFRIVRRVL